MKIQLGVLAFIFIALQTTGLADPKSDFDTGISLGEMTPIHSAVEVFETSGKQHKYCVGVNIYNLDLTDKEVDELLQDSHIRKSGAVYCKAMKCKKCDAVMVNSRTK